MVAEPSRASRIVLPCASAAEYGSPEMKKGEYKFDDDARSRFLKHYRDTGRFNESARAADVCPFTARTHRENDPEFAEQVKEALMDYRESVEREVHERGIVGWKEPVFWQGMVVGEKLVKSDRMLELQAKRHIPEYREKQTLDVKHSGGVLVVPTAQMTVEEWEAANRSNTEEEES